MICARFRIDEPSQRGEARRVIQAQAASLGFDQTKVARVALVVNELAGNLLKHVRGGGDLIATAGGRVGQPSLDVLSVDRGPGIRDARQALADGYSTAGTAGTGLGAVRRVSDAFDLYSSAETGTVVVSRFWRDARPQDDVMQVGGVCVAMGGQSVSGDAYAVADIPAGVRILLADGLGHGPAAEVAASAAVRLFAQANGDLTKTLEVIHHGLQPTRGAAVAIAEVRPRERMVAFAGIGNISGVILTRDSERSLVSHNGTVGHAIRRIQEFQYELPDAAVTILHSDGLKSRWTLDNYRGLLQRDPAVIAGVLLRDFERGRDDASVVVARA